MAIEYKLSHTAAEIDRRLSKIDDLVQTVNGIVPDENGNVDIPESGGKSGEWIDLFKYQTLAEDVSRLIFDGFEAKKILIYGQWRLNDADNTITQDEKRYIISINEKADGNYCVIHKIFARETTTFDQRVLLDCDSGVVLASILRSGGAPSIPDIQGESRQQYVDTINRICISFTIDGDYFLKAGSKLGVKAYVCNS